MVDPRGRWRLAAASIAVGSVTGAVGLPFLWMIAASFKSNPEIYGNPAAFWPESLSWGNYELLWSDGGFPFLRLFSNSLAVAIVQTAVAVCTATMAGFVLGRYTFPGRRLVFGAALSTIVLPPPLLLIPLFLWIGEIGLTDTLLGVIMPGSVGGVGVLFISAIMRRLPRELFDQARVEGAGEYALFWLVALPLARPGIATYAFLHFVLAWHEHLLPLVVLRSPDRFTLGLVLAGMAGSARFPQGMVMAASVAMVVPAAVAYLIVRRHFAAALAALNATEP
ncbi:MAG TPA: carbohydrate ABC transporter permease [Limnochordia bacterium]